MPTLAGREWVIELKEHMEKAAAYAAHNPRTDIGNPGGELEHRHRNPEDGAKWIWEMLVTKSVEVRPAEPAPAAVGRRPGWVASRSGWLGCLAAMRFPQSCPLAPRPRAARPPAPAAAVLEPECLLALLAAAAAHACRCRRAHP